MIPREFVSLLAGLACLIVSGCGTWQTSEPITPTSYQISREGVSRSVGKLRRMAVLQVEQMAPTACGATADSEAVIRPVDLEVRDELLTRRKGYEVIVPDAKRYAEWLVPPGSAAFVGEVMLWPSTVDDFSAGPLTRALLERLRLDDLIDGLLILRVQYTCSNAIMPFRGLMAITTLGISEILPDPKLRETYMVYRITVFETSSGRVVWQVGKISSNLQLIDSFSLRDSKVGTPTDMEHLFEDFEPAVPKILTR
jgi:hypothetical protein